ncbi:MBL fold metallo-hydrolase [Krasilnikoviella flava]|uniref:Glyoxylase, beta-lactamase superfamily II n=1 Tax=Krasilnikoviella flava TaxID=526729 RepID=A0A1T5M4G8_9MICO|nr:MBL fold metallo-hydrolase [Krasilnikoviella flava]SKC82749.1 Glyoxylase, beta-lactamase superfamily II [Krasilnikoviella flava]
MGFVPVVAGSRGVEEVLVRTARRLRTTSTLVLAAPGSDAARAAFLVDPAWEPDELVAVADEVRARRARLVAGFSTHAHHDHLLWHPRLGLDVPRWATARAAEVAHRCRGRLLEEARADAARYGGAAHTAEVLELLGLVTAVPAGERGVPDPDGVLPPTEVVAHDAHAPGHGAVWLPRSRVLVAGDVLSDVELPLPRDEITGGREGGRADGQGAVSDVEDYLAGLDRLAPYAARCAVLVPGHGTPSTDAVARLAADRRYLEAVLAGRTVDDPRLGLPAAAEADRRLRADLAR